MFKILRNEGKTKAAADGGVIFIARSFLRPVEISTRPLEIYPRENFAPGLKKRTRKKIIIFFKIYSYFEGAAAVAAAVR